MSNVELPRRRSGKSLVQVHDEDVLASIVNEGQKAQTEIERRFKVDFLLYLNYIGIINT